MLFKAVLFAVMLYLAACYAYGIYLLWKLWVGRRLAGQPEGVDATVGEIEAASRAQATYVAPAKAA